MRLLARRALFAYADEHDLRLELATAGWSVSVASYLSAGTMHYIGTARRHEVTVYTLRTHVDSASALADLSSEARVERHVR